MDFSSALDFVLKKEGGYVNDPTDRGGETNFGISARANPGVDIKNLTKEKAGEIYKSKYWDAVGAEALPENMRLAAFDAAVNHGVGAARRMLAQAKGDLTAFIGERKKVYDNLVASDPKQGKFAKGWANRLDSLVAAVQHAETPPMAETPVAEAQAALSGIDPIARGPKAGAHVAADKQPTLADFRRDVAQAGGVIGTALAAGAQSRAVSPDMAAQIAAHDSDVIAPREKAQATGFGDALHEALRDPDVMSWRVIDTLLRDREDPWQDGDSYMLHAEEWEKDLSTREVEHLREQGVEGPQAAQRARAELILMRDRNKVYTDAGELAAVTATLTAGMADPTALVLGLGVGAAARAARAGSGAFIAAGRPGAAVASHIGEQVASELAVTGMQDITGSVLSPSDYMLAPAGAALLGGLGSRGVYRAAAEKAVFDNAHAIGNTAVINSLNDGDSTRTQQRVDEQIADIDNIVKDTGAFNKTKVMDEADIQAIRDEFEGKAADEEIDVPPVKEDQDQKPVTPDDIDTGSKDPQVKVDEKIIAANDDEFPDVPKLPDLDEPDVPDPAFLDDIAELPEVDGLDVTAKVEQPAVVELVSLEQALREVAENFEKQGDFAGAARAWEDLIATTTDEKLLGDWTQRWIGAKEAAAKAQAERPLRLLAEGDKIATEGQNDTSVTTQTGKKSVKQIVSDVKTVFTGIMESTNPAFDRHKKLVQAILDRAGATMDVPFIFAPVRRGYSSYEGGVVTQFGTPEAKIGDDGKVRHSAKAGPKGLKLEDTLAQADQWTADTAVHEVVHAITQHAISLWESPHTRTKLHPEVVAAVDKLDGVLKRLQAQVTPADKKLLGNREHVYAASNLHELIAMAMTDEATQKFLSKIPAATSGGGRFSSMLQEILGYVKEVVLGGKSDRSALDEVFETFDILTQVRDTATITDVHGSKIAGWPGAEAPRSVAPPAQTYQWNERSFVQDRILATKGKAWTRDVRALTEGAVKSYDQITALPNGSITAVGTARTNPKYALALEAIRDLAPQFLGARARVIIGAGTLPNSNGVCLTAGVNHVIGLSSKQEPVAIMRTALHELGHAVYHQWATKVSPSILDAMRFDYEAFLRDVSTGNPDQVAARFSATSVHAVKNRVGYTDYALSFDEFTAEQFVKYVETHSLSGREGGLGAKTRAAMVSLIQQVMDLFTAAKARGYAHPAQSFTTFFDDIVNRRGVPQAMEPPAAPVNPVTLPKARQAFAQRLFQRAEDFLVRNPIDRAKLRVITAKIGGMSDGLRLAASGNPILNMVASLVTETTTGAAGRLTTVAIRKELTARQIMGNAVIDYQFSYDSWKARNKVGVFDDLVSGDAKRKFDKEVYLEILARRNRQASVSQPEVIAAANAVQAMFERARVAQVNAQTLGSGNLPTTAEGYMPQALSGRVLADADPRDVQELTEHLANQFASTYNWSQQFSDDFANFYLQRSRARAMGARGQDITAQSVDDTDLIRQTLEDMAATTHNPALKQQAVVSKRGLGHTKGRLDVGLQTRLPSGKMVLDFYDTGVLDLTRRYVNRTSGSVALMEFGIAGDVGIKQMREAATNFAKTQKQIPTREELDAFDRVMAEISGLPIPGEVRSRWAGNLRLFTGIQRLGSMAVAQFAETSNMLHHLGLSSTLSGIAALPKMMGEVGRLKKGQASANHVLKSIDFMGGEIGMETYKMTIPLDPPDNQVGTYIQDMGLASKLLAGASNLHSKVSLFRGLLAAQHRATAEQIVLKAVRYAQDIKFNGNGTLGVNGASKAMKDMGFSDELLAHLHQNLNRIAQFDSTGHLVDLDITKLPHPGAAQAFVQAVHRGTSQIIQGTFIGERSAWLHNDYAKLALQFRTFGLTAVEKQWGRQRMNRGYAYAAGVLLGQMAFALPLHLARVQLNAAGREDSKEYVKNNLHPLVITKALMNYGSMSGLAGDVLDITAGIAGGWGGTDAKELLGAHRNQSLTVGSVVPALGSLDAATNVVSGNASAYNALKQLPGSNLPYIIPFINFTK